MRFRSELRGFYRSSPLPTYRSIGYKQRLISVLASLMLLGSAFAAQDLPDCPGIASIQSMGVSDSSMISTGSYYTYTTSPFDTGSQWLFAIWPISAVDDTDAIDQSNQLLATLDGSPSAQLDTNSNTWFCSYPTPDTNLYALATQLNLGDSRLKLRSFIDNQIP